jgi:transforming growth factor-beta-induced protein
VPSDEAFKKLDADVMDELLKDTDKLEEVLKHHVVPDSTIKGVRDLAEGEPLRTFNLKNPLHIQELNVWPHGRVRTVQCANIISRPIEGCNGNIVLVDKVLIPPKGNVIDVLALNANLTRFVSLLKSAGLADELQAEGPFTIFAPNDEAFRSMRKRSLKNLEDNPQMLKNFLKNHIARGVTCCSLIRHGSYMGSGSIRIPSFAGQENHGNQLRLHSFHGLHNFVNQAQILKCDAVASNGLVHVINDVLKPRELERPNSRHHSMNSFFHRIFDGFHLRDPRGRRQRGFGEGGRLFGQGGGRGGRRSGFFQIP